MFMLRFSCRTRSFFQLSPDQLFSFQGRKDFFARTFSRPLMDLSAVIEVFEKLVPRNLAEEWDNTGLLIEPVNKKLISTILFTNDLTGKVLKEAINLNTNLIISYHPPIFAPMKSLKATSWKENIAIQCIENCIAVYSPHTACDAVKDGVNDWLLSCFELNSSSPIKQSFAFRSKHSHRIDFNAPLDIRIEEVLEHIPNAEVVVTGKFGNYSHMHVLIDKNALANAVEILSSKDAISSLSVSSINPLPIPSHGMGRIGKLKNSLNLQECIKCVKKHVKLDNIRFALASSHSFDTKISTVAVCAGSGASLLKNVAADLYVTGEMSHHDILDATHKNVSVILCEHSNSERGYLQTLIDQLNPKLPGLKLVMSAEDSDPITIV